MRTAAVLLALFLGSLGVTTGADAAFRFPAGLPTDQDKGTWIMQEANRIGLDAVAAARRRPLSEDRLRAARATLQAMVDPCVRLGRHTCSDGLAFINYYTERIDDELKSRRVPTVDDTEDQAYRRALEARRLPAWEHEMMVARRPWVGMPETLLRLAWGPPDRISRNGTAPGSFESWSYGATSTSVTLVDGHVTAITQPREAP